MRDNAQNRPNPHKQALRGVKAGKEAERVLKEASHICGVRVATNYDG